MPTERIPAEQSLLGAGAVVFSELSQPRTVTALWEAVRESGSVGTFERFVLAVTMLYTLRMVRFEAGVIIKGAP